MRLLCGCEITLHSPKGSRSFLGFPQYTGSFFNPEGKLKVVKVDIPNAIGDAIGDDKL